MRANWRLTLNAPLRANKRSLLLVLPTCHFDPVQLLFDSMKSVVPDFVIGTHVEDRLPSCFQRSAMQAAVRGARGGVEAAVRRFVSQLSRELLPEELRGRRLIVGQARECGTQRPFTRCDQLMA